MKSLVMSRYVHRWGCRHDIDHSILISKCVSCGASKNFYDCVDTKQQSLISLQITMVREKGDILGFFSQFDLMVALFQNELWQVGSIVQNANDIFYSGHDVSFSSNGDVGVSDVDTLWLHWLHDNGDRSHQNVGPVTFVMSSFSRRVSCLQCFFFSFKGIQWCCQATSWTSFKMFCLKEKFLCLATLPKNSGNFFFALRLLCSYKQLKYHDEL